MRSILLRICILIGLFSSFQFIVFANIESISHDAFRDLHIDITDPIAKKYYANDGVLIRGRVLDKNEYVLFFLKNINTDEQIMETAKTNSNGDFQIPISLPMRAGEYSLIITSGLSFHTTISETIIIVDKNNLSNSPVSNLPIRPYIVYDKNPYLFFWWDFWAQLSFDQNNSIQKKSWKIIMLNDIPLKLGSAKVSISWVSLSSPSSLDQIRNIWFTWTGTVYIDRIHDVIGKNLVSLNVLRSIATMQFRIKKWEKVKSEYFLTYPNGDVIEYSFQKKYIGTDWYLLPDILIRQSFPLANAWVYKIETVRNNGYAYFNIPISKSLFWSIINPITEEQKMTLRNNKKAIDTDTLNRINSLRLSLGKSILVQDSKLTDLAQQKSQDMADDNYLWHVTRSGLNIVEFAKTLGIKLTGSIWENVAGWNISDISLQDGLEESGSHRYNMLNQKWKKIWIGYTLRDGKSNIVQIFGE